MPIATDLTRRLAVRATYLGACAGYVARTVIAYAQGYDESNVRAIEEIDLTGQPIITAEGAMREAEFRLIQGGGDDDRAG